MFFPVEEWLAAFLLTLAVEVPLAVVLLRRALPREPSTARLVLIAAFANLASHPLVWFVFTQLFLVGTPAYVAAAEGWAFAIEALFYWTVLPRRLGAARAVGVSLLVNLASFLAGRLLWQVVPDLLR